MRDPSTINFEKIDSSVEELYRRLYEINPKFEKVPMSDLLSYNNVPKETIDTIVFIAFSRMGYTPAIDLLDSVKLIKDSKVVLVTDNVSSVAKFLNIKKMSFASLARCAFYDEEYKGYKVSIEPYEILLIYFKQYTKDGRLRKVKPPKRQIDKL